MLTKAFGLLAVTAISFGFKPRAFDSERQLLDRVFEATQLSQGGQAALELLERAAEGKTETLDLRSMSRMGFSGSDIQRLNVRNSELRAYAMGRIGDSDQLGALRYLSNLHSRDLRDDESQIVWRAAMVALRNAQLLQIADPNAKIEYLESTVRESGGVIKLWAIEQLCERGSSASLPLLREAILKMNRTMKEDEVRFCEARIEAFSRDPNTC